MSSSLPLKMRLLPGSTPLSDTEAAHTLDLFLASKGRDVPLGITHRLTDLGRSLCGLASLEDTPEAPVVEETKKEEGEEEEEVKTEKAT